MTVALEEYRSLRSEIGASVAAQQQILSFGTATIALVIGPGLGLWTTSPTVLLLLFDLFVPVLASMVVVIWFGEVLRMVRAGDAVAELEQRINAAGWEEWGRPALTWECGLRAEGRDRMFGSFVINWLGVLAAFSLIATCSVAIGFLRDINQDTRVRSLTLGLSSASMALGLVVGGFMLWRWRDERDKWEARRGAGDTSTPTPGGNRSC
jgi:hypothetical protein